MTSVFTIHFSPSSPDPILAKVFYSLIQLIMMQAVFKMSAIFAELGLLHLPEKTMFVL